MLGWQEFTRQLQQTVNTFIRLVKSRRREEAAIGVAAILFWIGNTITELLPKSLQVSIKSWGGDWIIPCVFYVVGLSFLVYGIYRLWQLVYTPDLPPVINSPSAIKGPSAFTEADGELFRKLGREDELRKLLSYIEDDQVRLVVLMGASGAGKTSLLRAGLNNILKDKGIQCHYWEAGPSDSGRELLRAIQKSWRSWSNDDANHSNQPVPAVEIISLGDLINPSPALGEGKHVIVLDQFEQLQGKANGQVFRLLQKVARKAKPPHSVTWIVAFRREFRAAWSDFMIPEQEIGFFPPEVSLRLFTPEQARDVISQLVHAADLKVEQKVIDNLIQATTIGGQVSSVDVGIGLLVLSELYKEQGGKRVTEDELNHFAGGAEGLLTQYIRGCLDLFPDEDREHILNAMLALCDAETNQRINEGKTCAQLAVETKADARRLKAQLDRLTKRDKRLLEQVSPPDSDDTRYRLPHERLIPALNRVAGHLPGELDEAKQQLVDAFSAWQKNKASRYLLRGKDLRLVENYWGQISWGKDEQEKLSFLKRSQQRRTLRRLISGALIISLVFLAMAVIFIQLNFRHVTIEQDFANRVVVRRGIPRLSFLPLISDDSILDTGFSDLDLDFNKRREVKKIIYWESSKQKDELFKVTNFYSHLEAPLAKERWQCPAGEILLCLGSLLDALKNDEPSVRREAVYALGVAVKVNPDLELQVIGPLIEMIERRADWVRLDAALALGEVVRARPALAGQAAEQLKNLLTGRNIDARGNAAFALGKVIEAQPELALELVGPLTKLLANAEPAPRLVETMRPSETTRWVAAMRRKAIAALGAVIKAKPSLASQIMGPLLDALKDNADASEYKEKAEFLDAARALGGIVGILQSTRPDLSRQIVDRLLTLLKDPDLYVRGNAAVALGRVVKSNPDQVDVDQIFPELLQLLEAPQSGYVYGGVNNALGEIIMVRPGLAEKFFSPLKNQLMDPGPDRWARENAAFALGRIVKANRDFAKHNDVAQPLIKTLQDGDPWPRRAAARALNEVAKAQPDLADQFFEPLTKLLVGPDSLVLRNAAAALGEIGLVSPTYRAEAFALAINHNHNIREGLAEPLAKWLARAAGESGGEVDTVHFLFDHLEGRRSLLPVNVIEQCGENANTCAAYRQIVVKAIAYWSVSKKQAVATRSALDQQLLETMRDRDSPLYLRIAAWDALVAAATFRDMQDSDDFEGFDE